MTTTATTNNTNSQSDHMKIMDENHTPRSVRIIGPLADDCNKLLKKLREDHPLKKYLESVKEQSHIANVLPGDASRYTVHVIKDEGGILVKTLQMRTLTEVREYLLKCMFKDMEMGCCWDSEFLNDHFEPVYEQKHEADKQEDDESDSDEDDDENDSDDSDSDESDSEDDDDGDWRDYFERSDKRAAIEQFATVGEIVQAMGIMYDQHDGRAVLVRARSKDESKKKRESMDIDDEKNEEDGKENNKPSDKRSRTTAVDATAPVTSD